MFRRALVAAAFAAALIILSLHSAVFAQNQSQAGQRRNTPGQFDFYVLALSWSPTFCASERERAPGRTPDQQCGARPYAFVVHGLWPQYEKGYPSYCQVPAPRLDRTTVSSALELMPSPHLVFHEWDRHGTCSGLNARAYFDAVRKARAAVKIPDEFVALTSARTLTPDAVEDAFVKANPGLTRAGFAVSCDNTRLREIRVCLGKDFGFRDCAEVARLSCKRDSIVMPPVRGGREADAEPLQSH